MMTIMRMKVMVTMMLIMSRMIMMIMMLPFLMNPHAEEANGGNLFYLANVLSNAPAARNRMVCGAAG